MQDIFRKYNKKSMELQQFHDFFPLLKDYYKQQGIMRLFNYFDHDQDGLINKRQLKTGLTILLKLQASKLIELIYNIYKSTEKSPTLSILDFELFIKQNGPLLKKQEIKKNLKEDLKEEGYKLSEFRELVTPNFNLRLFYSIFNITLDPKQFVLLQQLKKSDYKIKINNGDQIYVIDYRWFYSWKKFVEAQYFLEKQIQFQDNTKITHINSQANIKAFDHQYLHRPKKIQNYRLEAQYSWQIKQNLQIYRDYIVVPEMIWTKLLQIYGGGPQLKRIYPEIHPFIVNKVELNEQCKFKPKHRKLFLIKYTQNIGAILNEQQKNSSKYQVFKKNIGQRSWMTIDINQKQSISDQQIYNQCFICTVPKQKTELFINEYNLIQSKAKSNKINYGEIITIKNDRELLQGYLFDIKQDKVKVHFKDKNYSLDRQYTYQEFFKLVNESIITDKRKTNVCTGLENFGNTCYMNSIIQCLNNTPLFQQLLINDEKFNSISKSTQLYLVKQVSKLMKKMKTQIWSLKPISLRKEIQKRIPIFSNNDQQDADQFLSVFLDKLSEQILKGQPKNEKKSIIDKIFSGIQCRKIICRSCKNQIPKYESFFTLNIPVPEIQDSYYSILFYPAKNINDEFEPFRRYTIKVKKTITFKEYASLFSYLIKRPLKSLHFCQILFNEYRKSFHQSDYLQTLEDLYIRETTTIYVYQKPSEPLQLKKLVMNKYSLNQKQNNFPYNVYPGDYIDFQYYNRWEIGRFIQIVDNMKVRYETLEGENLIDISKVAPFTSKTISKSYIIMVVHRKLNNLKKKIQYFCTPFIVTVYEWMKWNDIVLIIVKQAQRFVDRKYLTGIMTSPTPQPDNPAQSEKGSLNLDSGQQFPSEGRLIKKKNQKKEIVQYENLPVPYRIKILNTYDQKCCFCNKITRIDAISQKQDSKKYGQVCKGCTTNDEKPISLVVNLRSIMFSLDWHDILALKTDYMNTRSDQSSLSLMKQKLTLKSTLKQCFSLYSKEQQIQFDCKKCNKKFSSMKTYVSKSPNILMIHLKRFKFDKGYLEKLENKIQFLENLSINQISLDKNNDYQLYAINCHRGSGVGGHCFTYIWKDKSFWIKCDDQLTTIVSKESIDLSNIYILFYKRKNIDSI